MEKTIEKLTSKLQSKKWQERLEAVSSLAKFPASQSLAILVKTVSDEDEFVRESVAKNLGEKTGEIAGEAVISPLLDLLKDNDPDVSKAASKSLKKLKTLSSEKLINSFIKEDSTKNQLKMIKLMGEIKDPIFVKYIVEFIYSENSELREGVIQSLLEIGTDNAIIPLIGILDDLSCEMKLLLTKSLGKIKKENSSKALIKMFRDESPNVRFASAFALGQLKDKKMKGLLLKGLNDPEEKVRVGCARALMILGDIRSLEGIFNFLENASNEILLLFFNSDFLKKLKIILNSHPDRGTPEDIELFKRIQNKISRYDRDMRTIASEKLQSLIDNSPKDIIILSQKKSLFPKKNDIELISTV